LQIAYKGDRGQSWFSSVYFRRKRKSRRQSFLLKTIDKREMVEGDNIVTLDDIKGSIFPIDNR